MNDEQIAAERVKFEAWDREIYGCTEQDYREYKGGFGNLTVESRWRAWQGALAAAAPSVGAPTMRWDLDEDASALLHAMTGTDDEPTCVTLYVGESREDDGTVIYGLHAYESEYPEEGVTPLVEFAAPTSPAVVEGQALSDGVDEARLKFLLSNPAELRKFVKMAQQNADDYIALNRKYVELLAAPSAVPGDARPVDAPDDDDLNAMFYAKVKADGDWFCNTEAELAAADYFKHGYRAARQAGQQQGESK